MFEGLMRSDHRTDADTLVFLREIDRRKIWAIDGYDSIFTWCVRKGHMSESVAHKRLRAAEHAARFPAVLALIRRGELHLSALNKLGKHLTDQNHEAVLERARGKTMVELDELIAELAPLPDVPVSVRPMRAAAVASPESVLSTDTPPRRTDVSSAASIAPHEAAALAPPVPSPQPQPRARVAPLSPKRFKLEMTLSERGHEMLRELEGLLSHASAGIGEIVERGLEVLLAQTMKRRAAAGSRPPKPDAKADAIVGDAASRAVDGAVSRYVPAATKEAVWDRDGGQCTYVSKDGHRCEARRFVQMHHVEPFARGGSTTVENMRLLCGVHNRLEGDQVYGRGFMDAKIAGSKTGRADCHVAVRAPDS